MGMTTFDELVAELDSGAFNMEVTAAQRALVDALAKRAAEGGAAKGEIKVTLKFEALASGRVEIDATADVKQPGPRKSTEVRWIDGKGSLAAQDPRQAALPLRTPGKRGAYDHSDKAGE